LDAVAVDGFARSLQGIKYRDVNPGILRHNQVATKRNPNCSDITLGHANFQRMQLWQLYIWSQWHYDGSVSLRPDKYSLLCKGKVSNETGIWQHIDGTMISDKLCLVPRHVSLKYTVHTFMRSPIQAVEIKTATGSRHATGCLSETTTVSACCNYSTIDSMA
jgi:hypothetical protein